MKEINKIADFLISGDESLENVLELMEKGGERILLVVDKNNRLLGTITDGDIRRELISSGLKASSNAQKIMNSSPFSSTNKDKLNWKKLFLEHDIEHLPICNEDKTVEKIIRFTPENNDISKNVPVLIFAGGKGVRMGKKYSDIPKSIIEVDGKALIQRVIENLTSQGFSNISIALNHKSKKIVNYLNKNLPDHSFNYIFEKNPLGTAGSLFELIKKKEIEENILAINSDILFETNLTKFLEHHIELTNDITVGTAKYSYKLPYGVVNENESNSISIEEKPIHKFNVLSGIYLFRKELLSNFEIEKIDMDNLIDMSQRNKFLVGYYDIGATWMDVGNEEALELAKKFVSSKLI
tara:strand:- start:137 stop:1195 length:1059 start_codon:yes stop_codon:yes gene_type:complete